MGIFNHLYLLRKNMLPMWDVHVHLWMLERKCTDIETNVFITMLIQKNYEIILNQHQVSTTSMLEMTKHFIIWNG